MKPRLGGAARPVFFAVLFLASATRVRGQEGSDVLARIDALKCRKLAASVSPSYRVTGAMTPDVRSTLDSGLTVSFVHRLTVVRRRALFFDRALAHTKIELSATLDTLTQQYALTRTVDEGRTETSSTDRYEDVQRWLNDVHDVSIPLPPDENRGAIELRVKVEYQPNYYVLWVLPWTLSVKGDKECR